MAEFITALTAIFISSAAALLVAERFSQPQIPAYITAGLIAGIFVDQSQLLNLAQLGIAFLVFIFGIKFDPEKITNVGNEALAVNTLHIVLLGILGYSFGLLIGLDLLHSLYFSIAATLSSSLVGLELISKEVDKNLIHGRLAESIHLIQDMIAVAAVVVVTSQFSPPNAFIQLGMASVLVLGALIFRKFIFGRIASQAGGSTELLMLSGLSILAGLMAVADYLGMSIVIGSFAAGIAVAKFPHNLEIIDTLGSIKDFFAAIFFVTLGSLVKMPSPETLIAVVLLFVFTVFLKPVLLMLTLLQQGYDQRTAFMTGVSLDQMSEFTLIIAIQAWLGDAISEPLFQGIILAATITMVTSSYTKMYEHELFRILSRYNIVETGEKYLPQSNLEEGLEDHVILVGYDIQGKRIASELAELGTDFLVIENDPEKISEIRKKHENFVYGNVLNRETWEHANSSEASLLISTAPFREVSDAVLELETGADKILRAEEIREAEELLERGAAYVILPELITSEVLKEHILAMDAEDNYLAELRRRNLLEVRRYLEQEEG